MARQVLAVSLVFGKLEAFRLIAEHCVHCFDDGRRIAARVIVVQFLRCKIFLQVIARHAEQARVGAAEAVDGLLGIADDEYRRLRFHRHRRIEPGAHDLPLQRIGILELVEQHVAVAAIELVLHRLGMFAALQQAAQLPLQVGEIHLLPVRLQCLITFEQSDAAMEHRFVEAISLLLGKRVAHFLQAGE